MASEQKPLDVHEPSVLALSVLSTSPTIQLPLHISNVSLPCVDHNAVTASAPCERPCSPEAVLHPPTSINNQPARRSNPTPSPAPNQAHPRLPRPSQVFTPSEDPSSRAIKTRAKKNRRKARQLLLSQLSKPNDPSPLEAKPTPATPSVPAVLPSPPITVLTELVSIF